MSIYIYLTKWQKKTTDTIDLIKVIILYHDTYLGDKCIVFVLYYINGRIYPFTGSADASPVNSIKSPIDGVKLSNTIELSPF